MKKSILFVLATLTILPAAFATKKAVPKTGVALTQLLAAAASSFRGAKGAPVEYMEHCYRSTIEVPGTEDGYIEMTDTVHPFFVAYIVRHTGKEKALVALKQWKQKTAAAFPKLKCQKEAGQKRYSFMDADEGKQLPGIFISAREDKSHPGQWDVSIFVNHDM